MIKYLLIFMIFAFSLNANIVDVKQLFNKKIVTVQEQSYQSGKQFYGKSELDESGIVDVVTRFDGFIEKLYLDKSYSYVKSGEKLATIYSDEILNIQKELFLAKRVGDKVLYESSLKRLKYLDLDKKEIEKFENAKDELANITIYAKNSGFVIKKSVNENSFAKKGATLFQIADYSKIWIIAKVYQKDINTLYKGMEAKVLIDGFSKEFNAKVDFIYPKIDSKELVVDVRLIMDNKELKIFPNMFAKVKFLREKDDILTLPRSAVLTKGKNHYVFIPKDNGEYEPKKVDARRLHSGKFEITDGLEAGDKVIDKVLFMLDSDAVTNGLYDSDDEDW